MALTAAAAPAPVFLPLPAAAVVATDRVLQAGGRGSRSSSSTISGPAAGSSESSHGAASSGSEGVNSEDAAREARAEDLKSGGRAPITRPGKARERQWDDHWPFMQP
jgi:hypothetical protein